MVDEIELKLTTDEMLTPSPVATPLILTIVDDDIAGIKVNRTALTVLEGGDAAVYTVVLNTQPTADIEIRPSSSDPGAAGFTPSTLMFTACASGNWDRPQVVAVAGMQDPDSSDEIVPISHTATSADPGMAASRVARLRFWWLTTMSCCPVRLAGIRFR